LRRVGAEPGIGAREGEAGVVGQGAAPLGANQRRKDLWRADRDALAFARAERQQLSHLRAARRHQPVEIFARGIGAGHVGAQGGAIIEAGRERGRAFDIGAVQAPGQRGIIEAFFEQPFGDQDFVAADALILRPPRRMVEPSRIDARAGEKGDFMRPIGLAGRFKSAAAVI
jgi:hypothetical protein